MEINITPGKYKVKLAHEDYEDWEKEVNIVVNEEQNISVTLKKNSF